MRWILLLVLLFALAPFAASAQEMSTVEEIGVESYTTLLPGVREGEQRRVFFWRPPSAQGRLPVLYMADGLAGLQTAVARLRPAIIAGRARPLVVVAFDPDQERRTQEYVLYRGISSVWEAHFLWFVDTVMPWAESHAGASLNRAERGVGGFSNGADFAIAAAGQRPDLFGIVLAHSPVNELGYGFQPSPDTRWVFTSGRGERGGDVARIGRQIARRLEASPVRRCVGPWQHNTRSWRNVSPGSIAWLYRLGDPAAIETPMERDYCQVSGDAAAQ